MWKGQWRAQTSSLVLILNPLNRCVLLPLLTDIKLPIFEGSLMQIGVNGTFLHTPLIARPRDSVKAYETKLLHRINMYTKEVLHLFVPLK